MLRLRHCATAAALIACFAFPAAAHAARGDLYIGDAVDGQVIRIDPDHPRRQHVVADGLISPDSGAFTAAGKLLIADYEQDGVIFRVNVANGNSTPFGGTTGFAGPTDVAIARDGTAYAIDPFAGAGGLGAIFSVTAGEEPALISDGQFFSGGPLGGAATRSGALLVSDRDAGPDESGALIRVSPVTGNQTILAKGGKLDSPYGMTLSRDGRFAYLAEPVDREIVRVRVKTGRQKVVAKGKRLDGITDVAVGVDGQLYAVSDSSQKPAIVRVDPKTGKKKVIAHDRKLDGPEGITVDLK